VFGGRRLWGLLGRLSVVSLAPPLSPWAAGGASVPFVHSQRRSARGGGVVALDAQLHRQSVLVLRWHLVMGGGGALVPDRPIRKNASLTRRWWEPR
jgi:hypothetical protein